MENDFLVSSSLQASMVMILLGGGAAFILLWTSGAVVGSNLETHRRFAMTRVITSSVDDVIRRVHSRTNLELARTMPTARIRNHDMTLKKTLIVNNRQKKLPAVLVTTELLKKLQ